MNDSRFSANVITTLKPGIIWLRYLIIINLIVGGWYLQWRINYSLNWNAFWLAIPLLIAEIYTYIAGIMFFLGMWRLTERKVKSLSQINPPFPEDFWPTIDVLIDCTNKPLELIETTATAALKIDYPPTKLFVYLIGEIKSLKIKKMADKLGKIDLETPGLQREINKIKYHKNQLEKKLKEFEIYLAELENNEDFLQTLSIEVETKPEEFNQILTWVDSLYKDYISNDDWCKFKLALGEGFDNVIKYGHRYLSHKTPIKIEVNILSDYLVFRIWDQGDEFDLEKYLTQLPEKVDDMAESGRGFFIFQEIADYFSYTHYPKQGNCLLMIQKYTPINNSDYVFSYGQSLKEIILLLNTDYRNIYDYLLVEKAKIEAEISEQEYKLSNLIRCRYLEKTNTLINPNYTAANNLNYALFSGKTSGEFILTLDANFVPKPEIIQRTLPYFYQYNLNSCNYESNRVAFAQTPLIFSNSEPNVSFAQHNSLFNGSIQQAKDGMGAVFYLGTNAVLRKDAFINIYSFPEENNSKNGGLNNFLEREYNPITDHIITSIRLNSLGWKSVYHNEQLALGIASNNIEYIWREKFKWIQGFLQVLKIENPWFNNALNFEQQMQYFQSIYFYFSGIFILIFFLCPLIFFYTEIIPLNNYDRDFAIHFIPAFLLNNLTFIFLNWGLKIKSIWVEKQYLIAQFPLYIKAFVSLFTHKEMIVEVTANQASWKSKLSLIWVQLSLIILTIGGLIVSIYRWFSGNLIQPELYLINLGWSIYNISLLLLIIKAVIWPAKFKEKANSTINN